VVYRRSAALIKLRQAADTTNANVPDRLSGVSAGWAVLARCQGSASVSVEEVKAVWYSYAKVDPLIYLVSTFFRSLLPLEPERDILIGRTPV
jgi:hypothetical protein